MALITDLPSNASPSMSAYIITDNGSTTSKTTLAQLKSGFGLDAATYIGRIGGISTGGAPQITITTSASTYAVIFCLGSTAATTGVYTLYSTASNSVSSQEISAASALSTTTSGNSLTITSNSAPVAQICVLVFTGSVSAE